MWEMTNNYNYASYLYDKFNITSENLTSHWLEIRFAFFRLLVIDTAKIFTSSKSQKYNIFKLLDSLETGIYQNLNFPKPRIKAFRTQLHQFENFCLTTKQFRDQVFAHTDNFSGITPGEEFFPTLEKLITLGYLIINELSTVIPGFALYPNPLHKKDMTTLLA
jgi:hypothetical protein